MLAVQKYLELFFVQNFAAKKRESKSKRNSKLTVAISSLVLIANGGSLTARELLSIFWRQNCIVYKQQPDFYSRCFGNEQEHMANLHFPSKLLFNPSTLRGAISCDQSSSRLGPRNRKFLYFGIAQSRIYVMQKKHYEFKRGASWIKDP